MEIFFTQNHPKQDFEDKKKLTSYRFQNERTKVKIPMVFSTNYNKNTTDGGKDYSRHGLGCTGLHTLQDGLQTFCCSLLHRSAPTSWKNRSEQPQKPVQSGHPTLFGFCGTTWVHGPLRHEVWG